MIRVRRLLITHKVNSYLTNIMYIPYSRLYVNTLAAQFNFKVIFCKSDIYNVYL